MSTITISKVAEKEIFGREPVWKEGLNRQEFLLRTLNWHNRFSEISDFKVEVEDFLGERVDNWTLVSPTYCALARMSNQGFPLSSQEIERITSHFAQFIGKERGEIPIEQAPLLPPPPTATQQPNIDKIDQILSALDEAQDFIVKNKGIQKIPLFPMYEKLEIAGIKRGISKILAYVKNNLSEINDAYYQKDVDLTEGYSNFSRSNLRQIMLWWQSILEEIERFQNKNRVVRKPRIVSNTSSSRGESTKNRLTNLQFKKFDENFKVGSIDPKKIIAPGVKWCILFDTKYRKIKVLKTNTSFQIDGTTISNFDEESSFSQILRKPELVLSKLTSAKSFGNVLSAIGGLTTAKNSASGRCGQETIILSVGG